MPLLSLIVPVYNLEHLISKCIWSIINQDFKDYELILINDGSTDNSGNICDKYAEVYSSIKVIHKKNGGLSSARNSGIYKAIGKYIWFIDGDDSIVDGALFEIALRLKSRCEIYILDHLNCFINSDPLHYHVKFYSNQMPGIEVLKKNGAIPAWVSVCNREFIIENNITFTPKIYHEDFEFSIRLYSLAQTVEYIAKPLYNYTCDRKGSIMNTATSKSAIGYASSARLINEFIKSHSFSNNFKDIIYKTAAIGVTFSILRTKGLNKPELNKVCVYFKENIDIICLTLHNSTIGHKLLAILLKINIKLTIKLYSLFKK